MIGPGRGVRDQPQALSAAEVRALRRLVAQALPGMGWARNGAGQESPNRHSAQSGEIGIRRPARSQNVQPHLP